jgi:hypothetical protein
VYSGILAHVTLTEPGLLLTRFMSFELVRASEELSNLVQRANQVRTDLSGDSLGVYSHL